MASAGPAPPGVFSFLPAATAVHRSWTFPTWWYVPGPKARDRLSSRSVGVRLTLPAGGAPSGRGGPGPGGARAVPGRPRRGRPGRLAVGLADQAGVPPPRPLAQLSREQRLRLIEV